MVNSSTSSTQTTTNNDPYEARIEELEKEKADIEAKGGPLTTAIEKFHAEYSPKLVSLNAELSGLRQAQQAAQARLV